MSSMMERVGPQGCAPALFARDDDIKTTLCPAERTKTGINPLQRMGLRPAVSLPLWPYKSKLLTPKPKACHHLLSEGFHPLQGDKQTINLSTSKGRRYITTRIPMNYPRILSEIIPESPPQTYLRKSLFEISLSHISTKRFPPKISI